VPAERRSNRRLSTASVDTVSTTTGTTGIEMSHISPNSENVYNGDVEDVNQNVTIEPGISTAHWHGSKSVNEYGR